MKKLTAYGHLVCNADLEMDYRGVRTETEKFIYQASLDASGTCVCDSCELKLVTGFIRKFLIPMAAAFPWYPFAKPGTKQYRNVRFDGNKL
jgi:hypothetical protein